jgi:hypothetical protein
MPKRPLQSVVRRRAFVVVTVVTLALASLAPGAPAQTIGSRTPTFSSAGEPQPTGRVVASKAPSSGLAQTDAALLARTDAAPVEVMIKLDYDSIASYSGGITGFAATSPSVTGDALRADTPGVGEYEQFIAAEEGAFVEALKAQVPGAVFRASLRVVYGGIAARIPADAVETVLAMPRVVAVQSNAFNRLLTDASPEFVGATPVYDALGGVGNAGEGTILGNLDTGVWPEHPSFADNGNLPTPGGPTRACEFGDNPLTPAVDVFACNDKLIGGDGFTAVYDQVFGDNPFPGLARDDNGHGTHTSSTSAGNVVGTAPVFGIERGPVHGLAPGAHVMEYRVCGPQACVSSDSAAAVGQAILDGVDVINFSISGGTNPFTDPVELAFLDAYAANVFVATSAGNSGPGAGTADHLSPWVTTVAASTQTREFATTLELTSATGETLSLDGASITEGVDTLSHVVLSSAAPYSDPLCAEPAPPGLFTGKVVACERGGDVARVLKGFNVLQGGAVGMILFNPTLQDIETDSHWLPTVHLADGSAFLAFMSEHPLVGATWEAGEKRQGQGDVMAAFSSRGPGGLFVKPDVTAPGVQILAGDTPFPGDPADGSGPPGELFQAIAGTSMSSPHVAGAALLLRAVHPDWTPGEIHSALMTTAMRDVVKENLVTPADPFDFGSGRIDVAASAAAPLAFDESANNFFALADDFVNAVHLNIPSVNAPVMPGRVVTTRVASNTTDDRQRYTVTADAPLGSTITVTPRRFTVAPGASVTLTIIIESDAPIDEQQFGSIDLTSSTGVGQHLPVAFVHTQGSVSLTQSCDADEIHRRDTATCQVEAANNSFDEQTVDLDTRTSRELSVVGASGATVVDAHRAQLHDVTLAGAQPGVPDVAPGTVAGYLPLDGFGVTPMGIGDEEIVQFTSPPFEFNGQTFTTFGVDSNGYIVAGPTSSEDNECCNLPNGPSPARPNNVLAPFWTDLDGTGADGIFADILTDGVSDWIVIEWRVHVFGTTSERVFQAWIGLNGEQDIAFAYDPANLPADPNGQPFLVGAENVLGEGDMAAVLPTGDLRVTSSAFVPGATAAYEVTVRGQRVGGGVVSTEMRASLSPGTTIAESRIVVVPSRTGFMRAQ